MQSVTRHSCPTHLSRRRQVNSTRPRSRPTGITSNCHPRHMAHHLARIIRAPHPLRVRDSRPRDVDRCDCQPRTATAQFALSRASFSHNQLLSAPLLPPPSLFEHDFDEPPFEPDFDKPSVESSLRAEGRPSATIPLQKNHRPLLIGRKRANFVRKLLGYFGLRTSK